MDSTFSTTLEFRESPGRFQEDIWIKRYLSVSFHQAPIRSADQANQTGFVVCKSMATFCVLRWKYAGKSHRYQVVFGQAIQNPKDEPSVVAGYRQAFDKAIKMLFVKLNEDYERYPDNYKLNIAAHENRATAHTWFEKECVPKIIEEVFEEEPECPVTE